MDHSLVNKRLVKAAQQNRNVDVRDMYALYHDLPIDVEKERHVLESANRIIFQFPLKWYSAPALVQSWKEQVLDDYWLHSGPQGGEILHGKELMVTVAYSEPSYDFTTAGKYKYTLKELLRQFEVLSIHLGVQYCEPFTVYELDDLDRATTEYAELVNKDELPKQPIGEK